jgi:hypothetical protein
VAVFGLAEVKYGFDVIEIKGAEVAAQMEDGAANETAAEGEMQRTELGHGDLQAEAGRGDELRIERVDLMVPVIFFGLGEVGGLSEEGFEVGIVSGGEGREGFQAEAVAREGGIEVRGVVAPEDVLGGGPGADFGAGAGEEGADEVVGGDGAHGCDTGEASATEEAEEDSFGLIAAGVAEGNGV